MICLLLPKNKFFYEQQQCVLVFQYKLKGKSSFTGVSADPNLYYMFTRHPKQRNSRIPETEFSSNPGFAWPVGPWVEGSFLLPQQQRAGSSFVPWSGLPWWEKPAQRWWMSWLKFRGTRFQGYPQILFLVRSTRHAFLSNRICFPPEVCWHSQQHIYQSHATTVLHCWKILGQWRRIQQ